MASWAEKVTKRFSTIPPNARENDFYAPHNKLFSCRLPNYAVLDSHDPVNFIIEFEVLLDSGG